MAVMKQIAIIIKAFLRPFLFLSKTIIPRPELTNNPANKAPNERVPSANNLVIKRLDAQFGIKPTNAHTSGVKYVDCDKKLRMLSSPTK